MFKRTVLFLLTLVLAIMLFADDYVIGDGTSTERNVPFYGYSNYGWSKFIYTNEELQAAGATGTISIEKIAFQLSGGPWTNYVTDNQRVYMRMNYNYPYTSSTDNYPGTSGYTQVYNGSISWNGPGWFEIELTTPYSHNTVVQDGIGYSLEILWENRDGTNTAAPPYFAYTYANDMCVYKNSDSSFPTTEGTRYDNRPNIRFSTPVTDVPPPASAMLPLDAASGVDIDTVIIWSSNGGEPDYYRFSLWTIDPVTYIENNLVTTATSYSPAALLDYNTTYYWRVIPHNSFGDAIACPAWSFTTMADPSITAFPWTESFDGASFPPTSNWKRFGGELLDPINLVGGSMWDQDDWLNIAANPDQAAAINIWGNINGWLISPLLNVPDESYALTFDLALLKYGQPPTGTPPALTGEDDRFAVLIGDGYSWSTANIVREWNNAGSPYVLNDINIDGEQVQIPLSGHNGRIRIAWYAGSTISNADNDIMINNVYVGPFLAAPVLSITYDPISGMAHLSWPAVSGANSYNIYAASAPEGPWSLLQSVTTNDYSTPATASKVFYQVKASTEVR